MEQQAQSLARPLTADMLQQLGVDVHWVKSVGTGNYELVIKPKQEHPLGIESFYDSDGTAVEREVDIGSVSDVSNNYDDTYGQYSTRPAAQGCNGQTMNPLMMPSISPSRRISFGSNNLRQSSPRDACDVETGMITVFIEALLFGYLQCEEFIIKKPPLGKYLAPALQRRLSK
jgi:hypothetical protein